MLFNEECRKRVKDVLEKNISVADTIAELNKKYSVLAQKMEDQENVLSDSVCSMLHSIGVRKDYFLTFSHNSA